jgi:ATP-binding cassette subfamily F protein uup
MALLSVEKIGKTFGIKPLFSEVTFGLETGEKIGVIGANGSGKSTLLRVLAGEEHPDTGRVVLANGRQVAILPQDPPFRPAETILEAVFEGGNGALREKLARVRHYEEACQELAVQGGTDERLLARVAEVAHQLEVMDAWQLEAKAKAMLTELGVSDWTAKMGELSGGQRKRVALAHSLLTEPDLLILDEPTNHLDAETVDWLERALGEFPGALLLVTHDRYFLDRVVGRMLELDRGQVRSYVGNYARYLEQRQALEERQAVEAQKLRQMARRELEWLRRGAKARTTKAKARVERAESVIEQSRQMTTDLTQRRSLDLAFETSRLGGKILSLQGIGHGYGDRILLQDFSYAFKQGDRIGVIGPNGAGKTTLIEILAGTKVPDRGQREVGPTVQLRYYRQEIREGDPTQRLIDHIREVAERIELTDGEVLSASQMLDRFLFPPAMQYQPIGSLSGGERRRLALLRELMAAPNVLLLDEVTNDLDLPTLVALEAYLDRFPGCLVLVSHDRYFLDRTVETIFRFEGEGRIREYPGNYTAFRDRQLQERGDREERRGGQKETGSNPLVASSNRKKEEPAASGLGFKRLSYKEKRELEQLVERISQQEARKAEIECALAERASDHLLVAQCYEELQLLELALDRDVTRWAELADRES